MLAILTYHSIDSSGSSVSLTEQQFGDQMAYLSDLGFRGTSLREALHHRAARGTWPERTVVLTFDDGYANFHEQALETLVRRGFSATLFLISGHIGGRNDWGTPPPGLGERAMLTWSQVREALTAGMEIGAHTRTHPFLGRLSGERARAEIVGSRREIEDRLSTAVESFAYPFGDASRDSLSIVQSEFKAGCTTVARRVDHQPFHRLPRVDLLFIRSLERLEQLLRGRLDPYLVLCRWQQLAVRLLCPT